MTGRSGEPRIELSRSGRRTDIVVGGIPYSTFHPERPWSGYAWDALAASAAWVRAPRPAVLLLGAGAGTVLVLLRRLLPEARLVGVELNPAMVRVGRERCGLDETAAEIVVGDALAYLAATRTRWDLVLDDMFAPVASGLGRPVDDEEKHLRRIGARLKPGGVAATNVTTDEDPPRLQRRVADAYASVFPHRLRLSPRRGYNAIYAGSQQELRPDGLRRAADEAPDPADAEGLESVRARKA